jgi:hypothetical protein
MHTLVERDLARVFGPADFATSSAVRVAGGRRTVSPPWPVMGPEQRQRTDGPAQLLGAAIVAVINHLAATVPVISPVLANKREAIRLRTAMMQVEGVVKMLQPGFNVANIAAKRRNSGGRWT